MAPSICSSMKRTVVPVLAIYVRSERQNALLGLCVRHVQNPLLCGKEMSGFSHLTLQSLERQERKVMEGFLSQRQKAFLERRKIKSGNLKPKCFPKFYANQKRHLAKFFFIAKKSLKLILSTLTGSLSPH